jgi:Secretion system C-terminal sorting domain
MKKLCFLLLFLVLYQITIAQKPKLYQVQIKSDGSISPRYLVINHLDTVEWILATKTQSIIPINLSDTNKLSCTDFKPIQPANLNDFTGPHSSVMTGIIALSPDGPGFEIVNKGQGNAPCNQAISKASAGNQYLCESGLDFATMDWTWKNPDISGVFIRLRWDEVHLGPGKFDWSFMDREISKAVANGKIYSLGFKAGLLGTPAWIFNPAIAGNAVVKKLHFRESEEDDCGTPGDMGSPADVNYKKHYFDLWRAVAAHIKEKNAWYRALGYVKPSGMNLFTHENRLPKNCKPNCEICNTELWAKEGNYTPNALYQYYKEHFDLLDTLFPDKYIQYALIQDGFPVINNKGEYQAPLTEPLPGGTEQTENIMALGRMQHGLKFVVSHNGLSIRPQDRPIPSEPCPNEGKHPAVKPFGAPASGCPNPYALREGEAGQIIGWQTQNAKVVNDPESMESALRNAWDNSDGIYVEFYEERIWQAETAGPVLDANATGLTLKQWDDRLYQRMKSFWKNKVADPFPSSFKHVFYRTTPNKNESQSFYYINPSSCINNSKSFGAIVIRSESSTPIKDKKVFAEQTQFTCSPNPFNQQINFEFNLTSRAKVQLKIYNLLNQLVATIEDQMETPGRHHINWNARNQFAAGTYIAQIKINEQELNRKIIEL